MCELITRTCNFCGASKVALSRSQCLLYWTLFRDALAHGWTPQQFKETFNPEMCWRKTNRQLPVRLGWCPNLENCHSKVVALKAAEERKVRKAWDDENKDIQEVKHLMIMDAVRLKASDVVRRPIEPHKEPEPFLAVAKQDVLARFQTEELHHKQKMAEQAEKRAADKKALEEMASKWRELGMSSVTENAIEPSFKLTASIVPPEVEGPDDKDKGIALVGERSLSRECTRRRQSSQRSTRKPEPIRKPEHKLHALELCMLEVPLNDRILPQESSAERVARDFALTTTTTTTAAAAAAKLPRPSSMDHKRAPATTVESIPIPGEKAARRRRRLQTQKQGLRGRCPAQLTAHAFIEMVVHDGNDQGNRGRFVSKLEDGKGELGMPVPGGVPSSPPFSNCCKTTRQRVVHPPPGFNFLNPRVITESVSEAHGR